jgi:cyclopropane-fatty-acyl-phospholipid synthase
MQVVEDLNAYAERQPPHPRLDISPQIATLLGRGGIFGLGEAYVRGEWSSSDLKGLLRELFERDARGEGPLKKWSPATFAYILKDWVTNAQVGEGAYEVARRHYDLGNDLFTAMLDSETMTYTCGYWRNATSLNQAQLQKLDLLCRKLKLEPGMRVLDIGCGWGNFAYFAAKRYGVSVVGLTVSKEQAALARERCAGLDVEILLQDYQTFSGQFDRVVSIEMIEAVGRKNIPVFFGMVERCLKEKGLFGLQVISAETFSSTSRAGLDQYILWLRRRIFPNGYIIKLAELMAPARRDFVLEDLHNFSADYARTLAAWRERFLAAWPSLKDKYGEPFKRMWLYYLCGCEALFEARLVQLYQIVYSKGGVPGVYSVER